MNKRFSLYALSSLVALAIAGCSDDDDPITSDNTSNSGNSGNTEQTDNQDSTTADDTTAGDDYSAAEQDGGTTAEASWGSYFPSDGGAYVDGELTLTFDSTPTLGTSGLITIYESDGTRVDYIDLADVAAGFSLHDQERDDLQHRDGPSRC